MADEPLPASYPLKLYRGDSRTWHVTLERDTGTVDVNGDPVLEPVDLTGHTFRATVRATRSRASAVLASLVVAAVGDPADGVLSLTLTADEADGLVLPDGVDGPAWWDLQLTRTADDFVRTYLHGKATLLSDVSHP